MVPIVNHVLSGSFSLLLAQAASTSEAVSEVAPNASSGLDQIFSDSVVSSLSGSVLDLLKAVLILVVGWIIAIIARSIVKGLLNRTEIDNQIASWIGGDTDEAPPIETWISEGVYWLVFLFALVAFLNALELEAVYGPLNSLLGQVTQFLPQIIGAAILLGIAWLLASLVKLLVSRILGGLRLDERLNQPPRESAEGQALSLSETIANALYWFIFLLFLPSILSTLNLQGTLTPVQGLLDDILAMLPNILAAIVIGAIGWTVAQIVRQVVTNFAAALGADRIGTKVGLTSSTGQQSLSWILGTIVYVLVLIPVAIAALNALQIQAITEPASAMLNQVLGILPKVFAASAIMIFAYIAGQYICELVSSILTGLGFNQVYQWLGLGTDVSLETSESSSDAGPSVRTPSELAGIVSWVGIMLVAALTAVDILKITALTEVVKVILAIASQVLVAVIIFAIGLYLANLAFNLIMSSGTRQARILAQTARIAIIILISAMALQQIGIAPNIVNLAFGLLLGAVAVAIAIAFGLGGKDIAAEQVRDWLNSFKQE